VQNEAMPPPSLRQQRVLPKPPQLVGSHIPVSVHSRYTSPQAAPALITVHSRQSDSYMSVIPRCSSLQQPSAISQEPHVAIVSSSTSLRLPSSTVEECPIDLSISKRKSLSEDKNKPSASVISTAVQLHTNNEQNVIGLSSTSPRHHQLRSQNQLSDSHNPAPKECCVTNQPGSLHRDQRMSQSHISQHISTGNSRHQQQIQASTEAGNKKIPSHAASVSTANLTTGNCRLGMKPSIHPASVPGSSDGNKHFETPHDQNIDGNGVTHREHVHVSTHGTMHYSHHPMRSAHKYHTHGSIPGNSYIPVYHEKVLHGLQSEQQQKNHIVGLHTTSAAGSDRDRYWSANKQISPAAALTPDQFSQDTHSVEGDHYRPHSHLVCGRCSQTARFMCSACHNQWYCSSDCQVGSCNLRVIFQFQFDFRV
jgi:hypothetical protein